MSWLEKHSQSNSLVGVLDALVNKFTVVTLIDDTTIEGRLVNYDAFMNIELSPARMKRYNKGESIKFSYLKIFGRKVRSFELQKSFDPINFIFEVNNKENCLQLSGMIMKEKKRVPLQDIQNKKEIKDFSIEADISRTLKILEM